MDILDVDDLTTDELVTVLDRAAAIKADHGEGIRDPRRSDARHAVREAEYAHADFLRDGNDAVRRSRHLPRARRHPTRPRRTPF